LSGFRRTGVLAALVLVAGVAHAQGGAGTADVLGATAGGRNVLAPTGGPQVAPMSGPVDPAEYVVGPGDLLQLNLSGGVTRSWDTMILPEGTLYVPAVGPIPLSGLTLVEARRAVLQRLSREYRDVNVDLRLLRPRTFLVNLIGESTRPGALEVSATSRASEVLAEGLFAPIASRRNVEVRRKTAEGEQRIRMDLLRFRLTGQLEQDPLLREGDVLFFPRVVAEATVEGAVPRAGRYDLTPDDSLSDVIELAGGVLPSAVDHAVLVRFQDATTRDSLTFRVSDVKARRFDTLMRDGDRVFVYYLPRYHFLEQASIVGEVQRPGAYPLMPGLARLTDLVRTSGGFLPEADLSSLRVFRASGVAGEPDPELERLNQLGRRDMSTSEYEALRARATSRRQDFRVDWNRVTPGSDLDIELRGGDLVRVDRVTPSVRVEGEVRLPGLIQHAPGRSVEDYVKLAGGYGERAVRSKTSVKRAVTGQTILARDVDELQPGDLVWVPQKGDSQAWMNVQSVLLVAAQLATVVLAIRAF
jgi:protein involved in polysaccharide export with SLBB domain